MPKPNTKTTKKNFSFDWLIGGILTKIGDTFDRLTGRSYKPTSSLATSELIERLKVLMDAEVKESEGQGKFVPHNLKLKMQWDKFSADSDEAIQSLENELQIAAIDHINDKRYHTYAPINIEIKPDYFTEGVKLLASFDKFDEDEREAAISVTVPEIKIEGLTSPDEKVYKEETEIFVTKFSMNGKSIEKEFAFKLGERKSVGRTKENDLAIDDISISKIHAAFVLNSQNQLMLADTGSTNGTFINGKRIAYGRAFPVYDDDKLKFGTVDVLLKHITKDDEPDLEEEEKLSDVQEIEHPENNKSALISEVFSKSNEVEEVRNIEKKKDLKTEKSVEKKSTIKKSKEFPTELDFSDLDDVIYSDEGTED